MPVPLKLTAQAMLDQDRAKRDAWLRRMKASKTGSQMRSNCHRKVHYTALSSNG